LSLCPGRFKKSGRSNWACTGTEMQSQSRRVRATPHVAGWTDERSVHFRQLETSESLGDHDNLWANHPASGRGTLPAAIAKFMQVGIAHSQSGFANLNRKRAAARPHGLHHARRQELPINYIGEFNFSSSVVAQSIDWLLLYAADCRARNMARNPPLPHYTP
jgi:hypothetical protein